MSGYLYLVSAGNQFRGAFLRVYEPRLQAIDPIPPESARVIQWPLNHASSLWQTAFSSASNARRPDTLGGTGSTSAAPRALAIAQRHDAVAAFLDPTIKQSMPDPNVFTAMPEAAVRIAEAIMRSETIAVFGDYDVDGATSAAPLGSQPAHPR